MLHSFQEKRTMLTSKRRHKTEWQPHTLTHSPRMSGVEAFLAAHRYTMIGMVSDLVLH